MKKFLLFLFVSFFYTVSAQDARTWDYPFKPGSEKWKSLKSHQEMVNICQIPEGVIHNLTTAELIKICLDYPLFFTLTAFNNMQEGFEQVSYEFNGFTELFKRKDFGSLLLKVYEGINPYEVNTFTTDLEKGQFMFRIFFLEVLLSQNEVFSNLNGSELNELLIESSRKAKQKEEVNFSVFQIQSPFLIMGRILKFKKFNDLTKKISENPNLYDSFLESIRIEDTSVLIEIEKSTSEYLKTIKF